MDKGIFRADVKNENKLLRNEARPLNSYNLFY